MAALNALKSKVEKLRRGSYGGPESYIQKSALSANYRISAKGVEVTPM
jgi:hypothetical protein